MSGGYYGLLKRGDKQFRRPLKTKDCEPPDRRLAELRSQVGNLTLSGDARLSFDKIAQHGTNATPHPFKPASITRRVTCIKNLSRFFKGVAIRNVQAQHCEKWLTDRASKIAAPTTAHELDAMRGIFDYAVRLGLMLSTPSKDIKRRKIVQAHIVVPARPSFTREKLPPLSHTAVCSSRPTRSHAHPWVSVVADTPSTRAFLSFGGWAAGSRGRIETRADVSGF